MEQQYIAYMEEIRHRTTTITQLAEQPAHGRMYLRVATESICLQFRYSLEFIARSSLVADSEAVEQFDSCRRQFGRLWGGHKILELVESMNPEFYPVPVGKEQSRYRGVRAVLVLKTSEVLTRELFIELYQLCGQVPYASCSPGNLTDHAQLLQDGLMWQDRIMQLLGCHKTSQIGQEDGF